MRVVEKAIWYIESHYEQKITLDDLAQVAGVSRFHLSRVFAYATGLPVTRYLRDRRLSHAARALALGNEDILDLALSLGYNSHEAFSRAFRDRFDLTPQSVRAQGHTNNLQLLEAIKMAGKHNVNLAEPRIEHCNSLLLAGLSRKYSAQSNAAIPNQWQEFVTRTGRIPEQVGNTTYGVVYNMDDDQNHQYLCAVQVSSFDRLPDDFDRLRLPEQTYAVFQHEKHVSEVSQTCNTIWTKWLPRSQYEPADSAFFEKYGQSFDPQTGHGGFEIWLPIK